MDSKSLCYSKPGGRRCLLNQERFAILDSRVSVALRELRKDGLRFLPILPRRKKLDHTPWPEDYFPPAVKAASMASYYLRYLALMRDAAHTLKLKPAEVEMALFMMGDVTCPNPKEWKKKRGALNAV